MEKEEGFSLIKNIFFFSYSRHYYSIEKERIFLDLSTE